MKRKISIFLGIFLLILISLTVKSNADYSSNDPVVTSGETISITVSSSENLQNFDLKLTSYSGLTYKGCSNSSESAAVNSQTGQISYATLGGGTKNLGTYTFVAPEVSTKTTYKVIFNINDSTNTSIVTVNPKVTEQNPDTKPDNNTPTNPTTPSAPTTPTVTTSNNANVKMIKTSPVDFTGFKASKTSGYEVAVENDVDKISVSVEKEDSKASVSLLNKTNSDTGKSWVYIAEGNNEIVITVTSEDGKNKKTYTINVMRKAKEEQVEEPEAPEENPEEEPMEEIFGLAELSIEGLKFEPQFQTDIYEYKAELKENLEKLNITTLATEANSTIEIIGNENLKNGENIITIMVKDENDTKTALYQIIVNKTFEEQEVILDTEQEKEQQEKMKEMIILSAAVGVILVIVIAVIVVKVKKSRNTNGRYIPYENLVDDYDEEDEVEEQTIEDTEENEQLEEQITEDEEDNEFYEEEPKKKKRSKGKRFK